jgi:hypothetical protein
MQVTDRKTEAVLPVEQIDAASYTGARVGDRAVLFSKTAEPSDRPVRFRLSGDRVKCLVADLAEGTWQVWRNGAVEHAALPVRAGEGVLYFETRGGVVELRR